MTDKQYKQAIILVSILVPALVAFLLYSPWKSNLEGQWVLYLPHLNATINSITTLVLIGGVAAVKKNKLATHKLFMSIAFLLGAIFLVSYITYHSSVDSTVFGDVDGDGVFSEQEQEQYGSSRSFYLIVLLSHIGLSVVVVPLVLTSFFFALTNKIEKHKRIVKFTFPIWLYVSISGVLVYFLISPFY